MKTGMKSSPKIHNKRMNKTLNISESSDVIFRFCNTILDYICFKIFFNSKITVSQRIFI